jgi:hypothetical protein
VQPGGDRTGGDRRGFANEDEEGGLKGVLGGVVIAENAAADAPHHRSVPAYEGVESRTVPAAEEVLDQLPVGRVRPSAPEPRPAQVPDDLIPDPTDP